MEIQEIVGHQVNQESRQLVRTSTVFGQDQLTAIEEMVGEPRGPRNRKFAKMMRVVIDAGLLTIRATKKTARV